MLPPLIIIISVTSVLKARGHDNGVSSKISDIFAASHSHKSFFTLPLHVLKNNKKHPTQLLFVSVSEALLQHVCGPWIMQTCQHCVCSVCFEWLAQFKSQLWVIYYLFYYSAIVLNSAERSCRIFMKCFLKICSLVNMLMLTACVLHFDPCAMNANSSRALDHCHILRYN